MATNRQRREDRAHGVNERLRQAGAAVDVEAATVEGPFSNPLEEALDRIRYGDCSGFGAPEARERDRRRRRQLA